MKETFINLKKVYYGKAYRLSTIVNADKIMLIEDGKITAKGKHKTLLKNKTYKKLYESEIVDN